MTGSGAIEQMLEAYRAAVRAKHVTFRGLSAEGDELRALTNRLIWTLRRTGDGAWKVVHEHSSAPADFETGEVMLAKDGA